MIYTDPATQVYLVCGPTDMRKGYDGLSGIVMTQLKADPEGGHLFVFCNRSRNRIKALAWDGSGLWVCAKRLDAGQFNWPADATEGRKITRAELAMLLEGLDWRQTQSRKWFRK